MLASLPTQRLSPKHQLTLARGLRALAGIDESGCVWARPVRLAVAAETGVTVPAIEVMPEVEIQRREAAIREDQALSPAEKVRRVALLNGLARSLSLDGQRRVVLPGHFVEHLALDRDVFLFSQNASVLVWNPADWLRYSAPVVGSAADEAELML